MKLAPKLHQKELLREVLQDRCPDIVVFDRTGAFRSISRADRERIVDALSAELTQYELLPDGEPTARGRNIDGLIGYFAPFDVPMHPTLGAAGYDTPA